MRLSEALKIGQAARANGGLPLRVLLATGFTPLHLQTFLTAHLQLAFPHQKIEVVNGLYGDLVGTLEGLGRKSLDAEVVTIEWSDLDPRLGIRSLAGWRPRDLPNVIENVRANTRRIDKAIRNRQSTASAVVSLPTLPLPPVSFTSGWQSGTFELELRRTVNELAASLASSHNTRILNSQRLDRLSPPGCRFSVKSELQTGFPYALTHADVMGEQLTRLLKGGPTKKGLITDLDDTLWRGIVGEAGAGGVFWDLEHQSQMHGVYQQMLDALAAVGVLIAVSTKNNPAEVAEAFRNKDLLLRAENVFPMEVTWEPKSSSVARILKTWNVTADSVVFVDDSAMELAEVQNKFPELEVIRFPTGNDQGIYDLIETLRDMFGKPFVSEEDEIRLSSIRSRRSGDAVDSTASADSDFLEKMDGQLDFEFTKLPSDARALELVNKTNQFNLNGARYTESAWLNFLVRTDTFLQVASYRDRYGRLGKIAVLGGHVDSGEVCVDIWVMSCRAFVRQIEYHCLAQLFERFDTSEIAMNFVPTSRNGSIQEFFRVFLSEDRQGRFKISRDAFLEKSPRLFHRVTTPESMCSTG